MSTQERNESTERMRTRFVLRDVTPADAHHVAKHRAAMFYDMGVLPAEMRDELVARTLEHLGRAIPSGEYVGWLATPADRPALVVAGAGAQVRRTLPAPRRQATGEVFLARGHQAIVLNVYTEPEWRKMGLATLLMQRVLEWAPTRGIESLVLHASDEGRPMYERLGFVQTTR